jgi:hypothetical protein
VEIIDFFITLELENFYFDFRLLLEKLTQTIVYAYAILIGLKKGKKRTSKYQIIQKYFSKKQSGMWNVRQNVSFRRFRLPFIIHN